MMEHRTIFFTWPVFRYAPQQQVRSTLALEAKRN
jgi:hypothetical protein